jgi:hypothetical protein
LKSETKTEDIIFKGEQAVTLENEFLRTCILPGRGAKIASLFYKPTGKELLWQIQGDYTRKPVYGDTFTSEDSSGYDDMVMTILPGHHTSFPWKDTDLPDHGELWSLPWDVIREGNSLNCSVSGIRLPYHFSRKVSLEGSSLVLEYCAGNPTPYDMDFLWTAHGLINISPGSRISVPNGMDRVLNSVSGNRMGEVKKEYGYPIISGDKKEKFDLSTVPEKNQTGFQKYYFLKPVPEGWCSFSDKESGLEIRYEWPLEKVPYLGIWLNEGGWADQYNLGIEPATAGMDCPELALKHNMTTVLGARSSLAWQLKISVRNSYSC